MRTLSSILIVVATATIAFSSARAQPTISDARAQIEEHLFEAAAQTLERVAESARGETLAEALFLLSWLSSDAGRAETLYRRIIDADPAGEWAQKSYIELAKVQYALGNYDESLRILNESSAVGVTDEGRLFQGLSALMLKRYEDAEEILSRIRKGKTRTWAYLSMAEADVGMKRSDLACQKYEALASALISPTALYRYGECLEDKGDVNGALREFREIINEFAGTPEAVLAAEKLERITRPIAAAPHPKEDASHPQEGMAVLEKGFTIQFGSFRDRGNAIKLASKIKSHYPGVRVDSELIHYREYHRVRYGYFQTREQADARGQEMSREMNEDYSIMTLP